VLPFHGYAEDPFGLITVRRSHGSHVIPLSLTLNLEDLAHSLSLESANPDRIDVLQGFPGADRPIPWQMSGIGDSWAILTFVPSPGGDGDLEQIKIFLDQDVQKRLPSCGHIEVLRDQEVVTVHNEFYEIRHDPSIQAGLPSRILWKGTGKVADTYVLNDRLYHKELGGFHLRNDPSATMEVLSSGPICVTVRVRGRYLGQHSVAHNPRAEYLFHYFAGSPLVRIEAGIQQDAPFTWHECHLMEINFPDETFTQWIAEGHEKPVDMVADKKTYMGAWGALLDGGTLLGLFGRDGIRIFDGRGGYGTYIHGPWTRFSGTELSLSAVWYLDAAKEGLAQLPVMTKALSGEVEYGLSTSVVEALLEKIRASDSFERTWASSLLQRRLGPGTLTETTRKLEQLIPTLEEDQNMLSVLAQGEDEAFHLIQGQRLLAAVQRTREGANLASLYDRDKEREFLLEAQPLWLATFEDMEGQLIRIDSMTGFDAVLVSEGPQNLHIVWSEPKDPRLVGLNVIQELSLQERSGESGLSLGLEIENHSTCSLLDVTPLTLSLARLGPSGVDDHVLYPKVSGGLARNPAASLSPYSGRYPSGWTTFQFIAFYDEQGGLYAGCHDPRAWTKEISVQPKKGGIEASMLWHAEDATRPGNGFVQSGSTVIQLLDGDWFDAAMVYRAWLEENALWWPKGDREDTPAWMKEIAIWVNASGSTQDCVPRVKRFAEYMGVPTGLHWYNWHEIPFDVNYPHYFPAKPGFAEGVAELQRAGVRVMPYINGRLWDVAAEDFETKALPWAAKSRDAPNYVEVYGSGAELAPMCPTTALWRDTVKALVLRLCGPQCNVDGVYIDQVAAAAPALCYHPSHGHKLGGGDWWTVGGYWPFLIDLRKELHALNGEKMITTESTAESFARFFDGYLTWNFWYGNQVPVIAALYGGQLQLFGRTGENGELTLRTKTAQALVWGEQIGWYGPEIINDPVAGPFVRRCARMRHHLREFLACGRMERPPRLSEDIPKLTAKWQAEEATFPAVQAGSWRARDGRLAVVFANASTEEIEFSWELDLKEAQIREQAQVYTEEGLVPGRQEELRCPGRMNLVLPPCEAMALILP